MAGSDACKVLMAEIKEDFDAPLTLNPAIGVDGDDLVRAASMMMRHALLEPAIGIEHVARLYQENLKILLGDDVGSPDPQDRRFADPAFTDNPLYSLWMRSWGAWRGVVSSWVDSVGFDEVDRRRAHLLSDIVADSLAPTNFLLGNPSAMRRAVETHGGSLAEGMRNFVDDVVNNNGMPAQVDKAPFKVGENLATTEGAVIHRHPILELIQYQPTTPQVYGQPVFIVPPQINKYYINDLTPQKSLVQFLLGAGFQVYMVSWRNPEREHRHWGLGDYVKALDEAIDVTLEISQADAVNAVAACAGGITCATALGYLAAKGDLEKVASMTLMVNVLDSRPDDSVMGLFATDESIELARKRSAAVGVLDGADMARVFNWMRPVDLIWNPVVSSYLHGEKPPALDILYWNNDTTRLPASLHADFLDIFQSNLLGRSGALSIDGVPIDLKKVTCPVFITGGTTDNITPWQACYRSTRLFGGQCTYVLSTTGHIQSLINPADSSERRYFINANLDQPARDWQASAVEQEGSWWPYWAGWLRESGADDIAAPSALGNAAHPDLVAAPGTYVFE